MTLDLSLVLRVLLGVVFLVAGAAKLPRLRQSMNSVAAYGLLPRRAGRVVGGLLPFVEIFVALWLASGVAPAISSVVASGLLAAFATGQSAALARGYTGPCGCFGNLLNRPLNGRTLAETLGLLGVSLVLTWMGAIAPLALHPILFFVALLVIALVAVFIVSWSVESARSAAASLQLTIPPFAATDLKGRSFSSEDVAAYSLVFMSPDCSLCETSASQLRCGDRNLLVVISGGLKEVEAFVSRTGLDCRVVTDASREVTDVFKVNSYPWFVRVEAGRVVRSEFLGPELFSAIQEQLKGALTTGETGG